MKITLKDADAIFEVLGNFSSQKLPIKLSYKIMKVLSELEPELQFYNKKIQELIEEYALHDDQDKIVYTEDGSGIHIPPEKTEEFTNKYNELVALEIEINDFNFNLDEFENLEIAPKDLYVLSPYITE
jgi:hypothetical protein